jgi:RNA polymerase sigma-70 factor (ECF subfamily)
MPVFSLPGVSQRRLLRKAVSGDARAFTRLYRELHPVVYAYLARRTSNRADAEDLTGRVFERMVAGLHTYQSERGTVRAWVLGMTRNALVDELRRRRPEASPSERADELADASLVPSRALEEDEAATIVRTLLAGLSPTTREIFALRFGEGLRHAEIAKVLGLEEAAVKQRVSRVLRALRERGRALGQEGVGYAL